MPNRIPVWVLAALACSTPDIALAQATSGWTDKQLATRATRYTQISPDQVAAKVTIKDDSLESVATLTTEPAFKFKGGFTDRTRADSFLRALISKATGRTIYQVYARLSYTGDRSFQSVNYENSTGPASALLTINSGTVDCRYGVCVWNRDLAFEVPEAVLRTIALRSSERPVRPWRFRFKASVGDDWTDDIAPAEIAGLLIAAEAFRNGRSR